MAAPKAKISITLSSDLLEMIDREADEAPHLNRSAVIELWLRRAARGQAATALREQTVRYYESLSEEEQAEDEAMARATSSRARNVRYD